MVEAIGRYLLRRQLGAGAFAVVWLAEDPQDEDPESRAVAIKVLAENWAHQLDIRERFAEEARILLRAASPRLVQVSEVGELPDGRPWIAMTYADRGSLADRLRAGPPPVAAALRLAVETARGVEVLHDLGVIHRDLKPSNVLFTSTPDGGERVLIADLGLAKAAAHASGFTVAAGSPGYMAPEQARVGGGLDLRADVYGLGAVTYHLLTGQRPPSPPVQDPPGALRPGLPEGTDQVVMAALAPDRDDRWPTVTAYVAALEELREGSVPPIPAQRPPREPRVGAGGSGPAAHGAPTGSTVTRSAGTATSPRVGSAAPGATGAGRPPRPHRRSLLRVAAGLAAVAAVVLVLLQVRPEGTGQGAGAGAVGERRFALDGNTLVARDRPRPGAGVLAAGGRNTYAFEGTAGETLTLAVIECAPASGFAPTWTLAGPSGRRLGGGRLCDTHQQLRLSEEGTYRLTVAAAHAGGTVAFVLRDENWPPQSMAGTAGVVEGTPSFGGQVGPYRRAAPFLRFLDTHRRQVVYLDVLLPLERLPELRDAQARTAAFGDRAAFGLYDPGCRPAPPGRLPPFENCQEFDLHLVEVDGSEAARQFTDDRSAEAWRLKGYFMVVGVTGRQTGTVVRRITAIPPAQAARAPG